MKNSDSLLIENKMDDNLTNEEKSDHYAQRFVSMKLVIHDLQQKLTVCKNKCLGMDSVTLMLKESKLEVVKLRKHSKALETALANLQNRLASNGLSSSVNIQETELYIPGASIQTLDNLAKENARLRNLLKHGDGQQSETGKTQTEDRTYIDNLEAENSQIKARLYEQESIKMDIVAKYDAAIEEQGKKLKEEIEQLEKKLKEKNETKVDENKKQQQQQSVACQTTEAGTDKVDELRALLKQTVEKCNLLNEQLDSPRASGIVQCVPSGSAAAKEVKRTANSMEKDHSILEAKLEEVVLMNKRWQEHSSHQEHQIHTLNSRILELENPEFTNSLINDAVQAQKQEFDRLRSQINIKDVEIQEMKTLNHALTHKLNVRKSQEESHIDMSLVEILKQQIQVCTEDFDTERKDREQAVSKVKELQVAYGKLKQENESLKKEISVVKEQKSLEMLSKLNARSPGVVEPSQFQRRYSNNSVGLPASPSMRCPSSLASKGSSTTSLAPTTPDFSLSSTSPVLASSELYSVNQQFRPEQSQLPFRPHDFASLPRRPHNQYQQPTYRTDSADTVSMPPVLPKPGNEPAIDTGNSISCPRCNKMFSESQSSELLQHISTCSD